ncbi:MAG: hypothetical protein E6R03_15465 [Hyphomicrobiaceae bacterium]|nr:MAG: hypothetical protein E6R03_15465 [Hyphomicrobiaceae bacterium]
MRFIKIEMESFASIGQAKFDLAGQGMVVVSGQNKDAESASSNGAGKSTIIVDSICWALFGKTTKGGGADSVTPGGGGKGTRVALTFEKDGHTYEVARHRKHKQHASKLLVTKDGQDLTKATVADTDELLSSILSINLDTFLYTTILGQGMMFRFSQLTDQARKEILEGIAGSQVYEEARGAAREEYRKQQLELSKVTGEISGMQSMLGMAQSNLTNAQNLQQQANAKAQQEVSELQQKLSAAEIDLATWTAAVESAATLAVHVPPPNVTLQATLKDTEGKALTAVFGASSTVQDCETRLRLANQSLTQLSSVGPTCNYCGSKMTAEHMQTEQAARSADVEKIRAELAKAVEVRDRYSAMHKSIGDQLAQIQQQERAYMTATHEIQTRQSAAARSRDIAANTVAMFKDRIGKVKPVDHSASIAMAEKKITELQAQEREKNQRLQSLTESAQAVQFWAEVGFQELRVQSIDSLLTFLNSRLAHYAQTIMGKDISVSLSHTDKGKIDLQVTSAGASYQSASGGEKDRIDVCIAFALLDLARQCTQWSSNILVLDEIATFVDASGVDRIMRAVTELMDQVESSFVISHNPVFEGYGDRVWTVIKEAGVSRLEQ